MPHLDDFCKILRRLLTPDRPLGEWAKRLGTTQPHLSNLIAGRRSMDIADAKRWARVLQMEPGDAERFLRLAAVTHIPKEARGVFVELIYELESLRRLAERLEP